MGSSFIFQAASPIYIFLLLLHSELSGVNLFSLKSLIKILHALIKMKWMSKSRQDLAQVTSPDLKIISAKFQSSFQLYYYKMTYTLALITFSLPPPPPNQACEKSETFKLDTGSERCLTACFMKIDDYHGSLSAVNSLHLF